MSITADINDAIAHIRHVIQEHASSDYELGGPANLEDVRWLANLLGWNLPDAYLQTIRIHDGVFAGLDMILSSDRAFDTLRVYRTEWHQPNGYWPVGEDGCGNYWLMSVAQQNEFPAGTVFFYDHEGECDGRVKTRMFAANYPAFVVHLMQRSCDTTNCTWRHDG